MPWCSKLLSVSFNHEGLAEVLARSIREIAQIRSGSGKDYKRSVLRQKYVFSTTTSGYQ